METYPKVWNTLCNALVDKKVESLEAGEGEYLLLFPERKKLLPAFSILERRTPTVLKARRKRKESGIVAAETFR